MQNRNLVERRYAEFYRLYVRDFRQDFPIYLDLAAKYPGPVLEVGCRTGRVAARLAASGYEVFAIDTARPMLELAVEYVRPWSDLARVADFDIRHHPTPERHGAAFVTLFTFNELIDVEEQRLFLRHVAQSMASRSVIAIDLACPLALARPDASTGWREIERTVEGKRLVVRDRRELLTPLLEKRTQLFTIDDGPPGEYVSHRRYIPPQQARGLLEEAGFEKVHWIQNYDPTTAAEITDDARPTGPFLVVGEK